MMNKQCKLKLFSTAALLGLMLTFSACNTAGNEEVITPATIPATITTPEATPEAPATSTPVAAPATTVPTSGPTPTITPLPTATPAPTATPLPTAIPTPTATPLPTPTPTPILGVFDEIIYEENTIMEDTLFTSEEAATRYFLEMAMDNYYQFGILVEDLSMLRTPEEYMQLLPEIKNLEFESLVKYQNGYCLGIDNLHINSFDIEHLYTIRTGDTSYLDETELAAYKKLLAVSEELQLSKLSDIDKIVAVHDYLILNTVYDEAIAASGEDDTSRYMEGTLLEGRAICSGYASAFQLFMLLHDIPCEYVVSEEHAWNLVQLDGNWYHIDVTWDDPVPDQPGVVDYTHFMMTDADIARLDDHVILECGCNNVHHCNDSSYRLYPYRDFLCSTEDEATSVILAQAREELITFVYPAGGTLTEDTLINLYFDTLGITGGVNYYSEKPLTDTHMILKIINN